MIKHKARTPIYILNKTRWFPIQVRKHHEIIKTGGNQGNEETYLKIPLKCSKRYNIDIFFVDTNSVNELKHTKL